MIELEMIGRRRNIQARAGREPPHPGGAATAGGRKFDGDFIDAGVAWSQQRIGARRRPPVDFDGDVDMGARTRGRKWA